MLGRPATDADDDAFHDALADAVAGVEPYPGIVALLRELREAGLGTGVATNSDARSAAVVLGASGLDVLMDTVVTVDQVSGPKPNPESIQLAVRQLGVTPDKVAFVGDSRADMQAARAAGVLAIAAGWGQLTPGIPRDDFDLIADTPADVARLVRVTG